MSQLVDSSLAGQFDRLPPHSIEAEMCLLASMMLDKEMIGAVIPLLDRDAFYQADHQIIFDILIKLYEHNRPIDAVIVRERISAKSCRACHLRRTALITPASFARSSSCASSSLPATMCCATRTRRTRRPK
jgi:replicative DNA helicase